MKNILFYFLLFLIYSFLGWIIEVISVGMKEKKFINRGFLMGPYCPIYGFSAVIMIFYLNHYKDNILTVFLLAVIVCSIIEYLVSYIMEKLFSARWWDYSNRKFNLNGRVCLSNAIAFGVLGVILVYYLNPFLNSLLADIKPSILNIIAIILFVLFLTDFIISFSITFKLKNTVKKIHKDNTEEFTKKVREIIENKVLNRRIFKAYPEFKKRLLTKMNEIKNERKSNDKEKKKF